MVKRKHDETGAQPGTTKGQKMITRSMTIGKEKQLAHRVLDVSELLEGIIVVLPTADIVVYMRVCKTFRDGIKASLKIISKLSLHGFGTPVMLLLEVNPLSQVISDRIVGTDKRFWRVSFIICAAIREHEGTDSGVAIILKEVKLEGHAKDIVSPGYLLDT